MREVTFADIMGPKENKVQWGTKLTCMVVSSYFTFNTGYWLVVEDKNRYPVIMEMYALSACPAMVLGHGALFTVINPYSRRSASGEMMLRVENAFQTVNFHPESESLILCWGCLQEFDPSLLNLCGKCKVALYCSQRCQKDDWTHFAHKHVCREM
jgi:hypothetical protein